MLNRWIMAVPMLVTALLTGCQGSETKTETKSLDNMARVAEAGAVQNQCSGSYPLMEDLFSPETDMINIHVNDLNLQNQLQTKVESALKAVPTEIQIAFFGLGGVVEVSELTHAICSQGISNEMKARLAEGKEKITGCWKHQRDYYKNDAGDLVADERVVIYVDANVASIEHSLVRTFGYVLSQVLTKIDTDPGKPHINKVDGDPHFDAAKERVTLAFLKDVADSNGKYSLERYSSMLGADVLSADPIARQTAWQKLKETNMKSAKNFMDYVFAETFDSHYCSSETKAKMESDFSETYAMFYPVADAILGLSSELPKVDNEAELATMSDSTNANANAQATAATGAAAAQFERFGIVRGIFRGVARVVGGIGRGIIRVGRAVVRGAGRVIVGAARVVGAVARGVLRVGAGILRATGRVVGAIFRGAVRVGAAVLRGAGRLLVGAGRIVLGVGRAVVRTAGRIVHGVFGPWEVYAQEPGLVLESKLSDADQDGVADAIDLCSNTPAGARVHTANKQWIGCAGGQYRDADLAARR